MTINGRHAARLLGSLDAPYDAADVARTDAVLNALARRESVPFGGDSADVAVRLLGALVADVDRQRLSSVSITPST